MRAPTKRILAVLGLLLAFPCTAQVPATHGGTGTATPAYALPGAVGQVNMLASPQNYENNTAWPTKTNIQDTTFSTKTTAPDGTNTGEKFIATTTNGSHGVTSANISKVASAQNYTATVFAKASEYTRFTYVVQKAAGGAGAFATYDLSGGAVLAGGTQGANIFGAGWTPISADILAVGGGWYRCRVTFTSDTTGSFGFIVQIDNGTGQGARSVTFAGDGVKGVFVWTSNMVPQAAWNHTSLVFSDLFTSSATVDLTNSKATGFNWYLGGPWPNSSNYTGQAWRTAPQQTGANFAVTANGLEITGAVAGSSVDQDLSTSVYTSGSSFAGKAFAPGGLRCVSMKFNPANGAAGMNQWPTAWTIGQDFLTGTASGPPTRFVEWDLFEAIPTGAGTYNSFSANHDWTIAIGGALSDNHYNAQPTLANNDGLSHRYCELWLTAAENGGIGYRQKYFDTTYLGSIDLVYASGTGSTPASSPSNATGIYFEAESETFPIMLASFPGFVTSFQSVQVWQ